ncbi:2Fe-2S iron-sulfur cluster binding domain-containing protein [Candidatus Falkowbacteria bacterium]|jgi:iron-only hydrogenase group A|nr:2Fe-2S iron-sulfur cluster binding domain-containing protein [Candidatus Falkowbacteria bacterium]MBT4433075.1 2Fe-2S iron-sulfur cluster binding domain-containing protein [Candidatus Falkowbacteria bacterium]
MPKIINIKINNKKIKAKEAQTVLGVAYFNGIKIPNLCFHPDTCSKANCRVCVVEIKGKRGLPVSCATKIEEGMEISTNSPQVKKARKMNLELIFAEHVEKCPTCVLNKTCQLLKYAKEYKLSITRFKDRKNKRKIYKFGNAVEIDGSQCIDCRNCIDMCNKQSANFLTLKDKGYKTEIVPVEDGEHDCVYCGQCAVHCPVASAQEQMHVKEVEKSLNQKNKVLIAQIAPSIRSSIGEIFNLPYGKIVTGQLVASLKKLNFDYVFDVNFGADVTTVVEAQELAERLKKKTAGPLPMFTSCCPGWVRFVEFYYPEFIPNLTTARSPHIHSAGVIKTYFAEKMKINPKDIVVVSIMPCTAKKFESSRKELMIGGNNLVDYVLTTRELGFLLGKNRINLAKIKSIEADNPLGTHSGAAAIYGASGGVMESALRSACAILDKGNLKCINFKAVRGDKEIKTAEIKFGKKKLKVAVVNGLGNARKILEELKKDPKKYNYIEVMACPGGCIGGGGQPIPSTPLQRKKRAESLYQIDAKKKIRTAHENPVVQEVMKWLDKNKHLKHKVLHTSFKQVKKPEALKTGQQQCKK